MASSLHVLISMHSDGKLRSPEDVQSSLPECGPLLSDTLSYEYLLPSSPWTLSFMFSTQGAFWTLPQWSGLQALSGIQTEAVTELPWFVSHLRIPVLHYMISVVIGKPLFHMLSFSFFFLLVSRGEVRDFPGDPMVKNLPRNARDSDLIPGQVDGGAW